MICVAILQMLWTVNVMTTDPFPEHTSAIVALDGFSPMVCICTKDPIQIHADYYELKSLTPDEARSLAAESIEAAFRSERSAAQLLVDTMESSNDQ